MAQLFGIYMLTFCAGGYRPWKANIAENGNEDASGDRVWFNSRIMSTANWRHMFV